MVVTGTRFGLHGLLNVYKWMRVRVRVRVRARAVAVAPGAELA